MFHNNQQDQGNRNKEQFQGWRVGKDDRFYDRKNALCSKDYLKQLIRVSINKKGKIEFHDLKKRDYYQNWLLIIKNDLGRARPSGAFSRSNITFADSFTGVNTKVEFEAKENHALVAKIDWALIDAFGYTGYLMLLCGMMAIDQSKGGFNIVFLKYDLKKQSELYSKFDIRPLHDGARNKIPYDYLEGEVTLQEIRYPKIVVAFCSFTLFGYYHQFRTNNPPSMLPLKMTRENSDFLKGYFNVFNPRGPNDYLEAVGAFLKHDYSSRMGKF